MPTADRSISSVLADIVGNLQDIVRSELRLAKSEVTQEIRKARTAGMLCGVGALLLTFSALFMLLGAVYALSLVVPAWAAALIVAVGIGVIAALCLGTGVKKLKTIHGVPKTTETLKENAEWAKQLTR